MYGHLCRVQGCQNVKAANIHTCVQHQQLWRAHVLRFGLATHLGIQRMLRRTEEENLPWVQANAAHVHPHDEPMPVPVNRNSFLAPRFYCVETICAPCGVVIAWTKFARAESPSNILNFLDKVYPTADLKPDYVCIDKACLVLHHAITSGRWDNWKDTTRFIVDSYHYINHRTTDYLCRKYCNPAPLNGSAPNLVVVEIDRFGNPHYKHAFNTQACEQLNAWLGGFESILKRMTAANFNWLLHTMLFMHTQVVIHKQRSQRDRGGEEDNVDKEESGNESEAM